MNCNLGNSATDRIPINAERNYTMAVVNSMENIVEVCLSELLKEDRVVYNKGDEGAPTGDDAETNVVEYNVGGSSSIPDGLTGGGDSSGDGNDGGGD